jgi:hypothetical protein
MARISCQIFATRERGTPWSEEQIDRTAWPWHSAPGDCTDYDEATWYACRKSSGGELPRQDRGTWVIEQRARRTRDVLPPPPFTEADHAALQADLAAYARERNADSGIPGPAVARDAVAHRHSRRGRAVLVDLANRIATYAIDLYHAAHLVRELIHSRDLEPGNAWQVVRSAALHAGLAEPAVEAILGRYRDA